MIGVDGGSSQHGRMGLAGFKKLTTFDAIRLSETFGAPAIEARAKNIEVLSSSLARCGTDPLPNDNG